MKYEKHCYEIVEKEMNSAGTIHEAYVRYLVGDSGFKALTESGLLEPCGVVANRLAYALKPRKTK